MMTNPDWFKTAPKDYEVNKKEFQKLEAERWDISYRKRKPKALEPQVNKNKAAELVINEKLKSMFFHAGRYSAGDRDKKATKAWQSYETYEGLK